VNLERAAALLFSPLEIPPCRAVAASARLTTAKQRTVPDGSITQQQETRTSKA